MKKNLTLETEKQILEVFKVYGVIKAKELCEILKIPQGRIYLVLGRIGKSYNDSDL